jgi:O-acetyl-ADP-ribose deacetylase (regulator of RNase III)
MSNLFVSIIVVCSFLLVPCCGTKKSSSDAARTLKGNSKEDTSPIKKTVNGVEMIVMKGDIVKLNFDLDENAVIVNAANEELKKGGGVCGAIYQAAGPLLEQETNNLKPYPGFTVNCPTGYAVKTGSYNLGKPPSNVSFIIHAVGPQWGGKNSQSLKSAYSISLGIAAKEKVSTIAFPCISVGIYAYPHELAADMAVTAVMEYIKSNGNGPIKKIIFVCYSWTDYKIYAEKFKNL